MFEKPKKQKPNHLIFLIKKYKKYLVFILITIIGQIISSLLSGSYGYLFKDLIDFMTQQNRAGFNQIVWILVVLFSINIPLLGIRTYCIGRYTSSIIREIQNTLGLKATKMPISEIDKMHSGDFVSKANNDLGQIRTYFSSELQMSIRLIIGGAVALGLMLYLSWQLTLITFVISPIFLFLTVLIGKPLKDLVVKRNEKLADVNKYTQDALGGYVEIRTYQLKEKLGSKIKEAIDDSVKILFKSARIEAFSTGFGMLSRIIPVIVLLSVGSIFIVKGIGDVTIGKIVALTSLSNAPLQFLYMWSAIVNYYKKAQGSAEGVIKLLNYEEERISGNTSITFDGLNPVISFKNVSFKYKKDETENNVLNHISFEIHKGEKVAFVGESGCGKSTIIKLIAGFYEVDEGEILISGINISQLNLASLRTHLSIVDQDTYLYPGTLFENIACGVINDYDEVPLDLVKHAAKTANIDQFIDTLPDRYDTFALERGVRLSGGQKQRIAMARACIRNAEILLLDEPTSALDLENERIVQNELDLLMDGKTSVVVAHRLTTIKNADRIFVIDKGNIIESGTHEELVNESGKYLSLLSKQLEKEREA